MKQKNIVNITLMVGISGSGKSTQAKTLRDQSCNSIIVSRDKIREQLFGFSQEDIHEYYCDNTLSFNEDTVTVIENSIIRSAILNGYCIIVDNTHLKLSYINRYKQFGVNILFKLVDTDPVICLYRNENRARKVPEDVIRKQYYQLQELKKNFNFKPINLESEITQDIELPACYVFDIDGTLAIRNNRGPFDWYRVDEDLANNELIDVLFSLQKNSYDIIICSGRDEVCRELTEKWLKDNEIHYEKLYMRPANNTEPDFIIKERMWREICHDRYIQAIFDDRNQVVDHARRLGFNVYQVNYGDF